MDELLPHYEYELGLLARGLTEFAERYPKIAARLGIRSGHADDPHVERLVQTFSFMAAHLDSRLADDYPEITEALLSIIHPQYLRGVPACAIAQFNPEPLLGKLTEPFTVPRGTPLDARAAPCQFRTIYDVTLAPLHIDDARYSPTTIAPSVARLPADATGILSITFTSLSPTGQFDSSVPTGPVRVHLTGERPLVAALADTLLLRTANAFVEVDQNRRWLALSKVPFEAAGFRDNERLLPDEPDSTALAFRYLLEYFAFPELFDFIDIDLGRIRRAARAPNARSLTLHVVTRDTAAESATAKMLSTLDASAFKLFCTPVINLFERAAVPIQLTETGTSYPVTPEPLEGAPALDIYSIDAVHLGERTDTDKKDIQILAPSPRTDVPPYRAFRHGAGPQKTAVYWLVFRDRDASFNPGASPWRLSLVGLDGQHTRPAFPQADVDATVTNGDLPSRLPIGTPQGDLLNEAAALSCPIALLTRPTIPVELPRGNHALWRVLATLSPHPVDLTRSGLGAFKAFLRLHAPRSVLVGQRCIDALAGLDYKPAIKWMALDGQFPSFVRGIEILLWIDEPALRDVSLSVFGRILDQFFTPYAPTNSYVQLVILAAETGDVLLRCDARPGTQPLV
ncbi:type VI secretion system baseplate subunit TssF [Burkholderia metallica]|uniref:type VI secretion system baseplate subunit TssF n=1 Tax=Burkholderia metallica TaxID=488729 RepID=UPI001575BE91|nr:type VI secretion system baseplate subunit TssF [Burkholderia metallica]NTZ07264.1 type VI secretion system baseplate subunit TssF [Burkholderia metallica]